MAGRILVPYDGSEQSANALRYATATFDEWTITLLHVVEPDGLADQIGLSDEPDDPRREGATEMLETTREQHDHAAGIETAVVAGRPIHEILQYTEENSVDHIVMGSHGRDGAVRLLLGSVAETIVRRAPVPVTVVRGSDQVVDTHERILVPFDGSAQSRNALEHALDRFETAGVTALYAVYPEVYPSTGTYGYGDVSNEMTDWEDEQDEQTTEVLSITEEIAKRHGREVGAETTEGKPAAAIVEYVEDTDIDHVVIGSTGRDGLNRLLLGSVAETVVRRSPVSVTVTTGSE
jgi:nucleotide-binding universal stress UspA family protein